MDFKFTEEQNMLRDLAREFTEKEIKPAAKKIDEEEKIPKEIWNKAAEIGLFGVPFPEEFGGSNLGKIGYCVMMEEISKGCASTSVSFGAHISLCANAIFQFGTEEQKKKYLVPLIEGKKIGAFALTEASAGSDASNVKSYAEPKGDHYLLNGEKLFITNGGIADVIIVFALTNKQAAFGGVSVFIVESSWEGFKVERLEEKMGIRGSSTALLVFNNVKVPKENLLGRAGRGFSLAMDVFDTGRIGIGAGALGASKEVLNLSIQYSKQRVQFGKPIAENQGIQWMLAEMAMEIYNMESVLYKTAWLADQKDVKFSREAAMTKLYCSEAADRVVDMALQVHGGMGYVREYPIERFYRDSRINRIFEGTNEIQKIIIARDLLKKGRY